MKITLHKKIAAYFGYEFIRINENIMQNQILQTIELIRQHEIDLVLDVGANLGQFATDIRISLSTRIYRYYLHKPYDFYLNQNSSILIRNINNETDNFQNGLISIIILLSEIIVIFGFIVIYSTKIMHASLK